MRNNPPTFPVCLPDKTIDCIGNLYTLVDDGNTHGTGSAGDHAHGGLDVGRIQVGHLGLGDLADIFLADGGDLGLVGSAGAAVQTGSLQNQQGGGGVLVMKVKERSA